MPIASPLADWPRKSFRPGGGNAFLFYVVHGRVDTTLSLSASKYRSNGIPAGFELMGYSPTSGPEAVASLDSHASAASGNEMLQSRRQGRSRFQQCPRRD